MGAVVVGVLGGAVVLFAATRDSEDDSPEVEIRGSGSLALTNSREAQAIFSAAGMVPGDTAEGTVTLGNAGSVSGSLVLSAEDLIDKPGTLGGRLSDTMRVRISELGSGETVYSGSLAEMPDLQLGRLEPGEERKYRFVASFPDTGVPASPTSGDNAFRLASLSLAYRWNLSEPGELPEAQTPPGAQAPPAAQAAQGASDGSCRNRIIGSKAKNRLAGTDGGDQISGLGGKDRISGGNGDDCVLGGGGKDRASGDAGNDDVRGGSGPDKVLGGAGNDVVRGGSAADKVRAGAGIDLVITRGGGADVVNCGGGRDRAKVDRSDRVSKCERVRGR